MDAKTETVPRPAAAPAGQAAGPRRAVQRALDKRTVRVTLPAGLGAVRLPSPERVAFYAGIGTLAVLGIVDWPVALVIGVGHLLADDRHNKILVEFGEALADG